MNFWSCWIWTVMVDIGVLYLYLFFGIHLLCIFSLTVLQSYSCIQFIVCDRSYNISCTLNTPSHHKRNAMTMRLYHESKFCAHNRVWNELVLNSPRYYHQNNFPNLQIINNIYNTGIYKNVLTSQSICTEDCSANILHQVNLT